MLRVDEIELQADHGGDAFLFVEREGLRQFSRGAGADSVTDARGEIDIAGAFDDAERSGFVNPPPMDFELRFRWCLACNCCRRYFHCLACN